MHKTTSAGSLLKKQIAKLGYTNGDHNNGYEEVSAGQREKMIREAAYFRAKQRGFSGGDSMEDWLAAESEVDAINSI